MVTNFIYQLDCCQQLNQIKMQDSLELPEQLDSVHTLLSPPQMRHSRQNTPPHSLAYSNSTCAKDRMQEIQIRSPLIFDHLQSESPSKFGIIKANNENYPINLQKTVPVSPNKKQEFYQNAVPALDRAANKGQYKKIKPKVTKDYKSPQKSERLSPYLNEADNKSNFNATQPVQSIPAQRMQQRKTIDKTDHNKTNKRVKQLEQALHMETVLSEQLRTKLSITNNLLESKLKENDLGYFFSLKNSSRDMKNIDIYVELTNTRKLLNQKNIIIDRLKDQIKESNLQIEKLKMKKGGSPVVISPNRTLNDQIQKLIDQKQSLMSYIDEQKITLKKKIEYIAQLEQELNRINNKSSHYTDVERPRLINQLSELKMKNKQLQELTETMRMQFNLQQLKIFSENQQLKAKIEKLQQNLASQDEIMLSIQQKKPQYPQMKSIEVQKDDMQYKIMLEELTLLKKQRDYYYTQYQKRTEDSAKLYTLQLKLSIMEQSQPIY